MIYVGTLATTPDRDSGWIDAFRDLGVEVLTHSSETADSPRGVLSKVFRRLHVGRANRSMQRELLELADRERPTGCIFAYRSNSTGGRSRGSGKEESR
jgi:hypothetical protein